jgi:hypothetical protein
VQPFDAAGISTGGAKVALPPAMERHLMMRILGLILLLAILAGLPAQAQERVTLGWGRLFSNDALGDGRDRWRTGGYQLSLLRGALYTGALPETPGDLLEFRASSQIIAPASLTRAATGDRRYVGLLSLGVHTVFDWRGNEVSFGSDLIMIGPQTGVSNFQRWVHRIVNLPDPTAVSQQIGDGVYASLHGEVGRPLALAANLTLRPFVEAQTGVEDFLRVGGDVVIGGFGQEAILVRDAVTGQRYPVVEPEQVPGFSFVMGADYTRVTRSVFLPEGGTAQLSPDRNRLRAGVHWQGHKSSVFYGVSYLSREFETQPEAQVVGALSLRLKF